MKDRIIVRNARQHNLKGLDVELPRRAVIVVTGPSGSGKSSLAFDTIYAEGQRRYVESLSSYAKQFLDRMEKPAVDAVEGISPAVAIEQKNPTKTSRSTVGTATEVHDFMRLLWARAGRTYCPECDREVRPDTVQAAVDEVMELPGETRFVVAFPLPLSARVKHASVVENLRALGFVRVLVDDETLRIDEPEAESPDTLGHDLAGAEDLLVVVDRLKADPDARDRLADSIATAFNEGEGEAVVAVRERDGDDDVAYRQMRFTERFRCPDHPDAPFLDPTPRLFSFNNPYGSCPTCTGFGATLEYDIDLIVPNPERSIRDGAVDPWEQPRYDKERKRLRELAKKHDVPVDAPWSELPEDFRQIVIHGGKGFKGMIPFMRSRERKRYKAYIRVWLRRYQSARTCADCGGGRVRTEALNVRVAGKTIADAGALTIAELRQWTEALIGAGETGGDGDATAAVREASTNGAVGAAAGSDSMSGPDAGSSPDVDDERLSSQQHAIARPILREIAARLRFLDDVGLGYLTLDRQARTLSGGEAQRISLANSLGAKLVDTLYVLDEPTIGLHPRDTSRLLALLERLRDGGNTVLVVEHDPAAIRAADQVLELGPESGEKGGEAVFQGTPDELLEAETTTGLYISGREPVPVPDKRRPVDGPRLRLSGARLHNLDGVDADIPLGALTVVTGVSGSGKSTLVHDVLFRALEQELEGGETSAKQHLGEEVGEYERLEGAGLLSGVVLVDQSPIGTTPRSNPVTYIKAFDRIRKLFAEQPLSKERGYSPGHFSFNVKGGRCEHCSGDGVVKVEMVFLADVYVSCEHCRGARYTADVLEVEYKGKNIRDVLDMTVDEAIRFFIRQDRLGQALWQLQQVGLGYLRLGQPAPTLSGGEAQRLKIARELVRGTKKGGRRMYILDEPTTGLSGSDVKKLLRVVGRLLQAGHTVLVIEHNLDVIRAADWVVDLGPEAGDGGGRIVAMGRPEDVAGVEASHTGRYLREVLPDTVAAAAD